MAKGALSVMKARKAAAKTKAGKIRGVGAAKRFAKNVSRRKSAGGSGG